MNHDRTRPEALPEVARLLGLPLGTVKSTASRALARLRQELDATDAEVTRGLRREEP